MDFVYVSDLDVQYGKKTVLSNLSWRIAKGEQVVLGGKSGTGKTTLAKAIAGWIYGDGDIQINFDLGAELLPRAVYIPNWYQFTNLEGDRNFYYQQRYNHHQGHDTLTVKAELEHFAQQEGLDFAAIEKAIQALGFSNQLQAQLIELSSGEHKKMQLIKGLWAKPQLLIIDEPYTGLDRQSRVALNTWLDELISDGVQLILVTNDEQLPTGINRYAHIVDGQIEEVDEHASLSKDEVRERKPLPEFLTLIPNVNYDTMVKLTNVSVRYGEKKVLQNVSWEVKFGEKWLLQGPNGSGKSTLLSLINADHPQAYGHDIVLFGKKRGSGESIWDIKEKIGMISPEMHWYFDQSATVWHTVASGFYDSIGWFIDVKFEEKKQIEELLRFFDLLEHKDELLHTLPLGKQRLALLARTIIKNPPLLVLDEPCQGLDNSQTQYFKAIIDELVQYGNTLIYVGHYESQLPSCIEHRIVLEKGEVIKNEKFDNKRRGNPCGYPIG
jgi:molybdate transport system ATP-binding protein